MPGPYFNLGAFKTQINANDTSAQEELGIWRAEGSKVLRYMKASALIPGGECVKVDTTVSTGLLMGNQVLQCSTATDPMIGIAEFTLALLNFGWVTVAGPATGRVGAGEAPGVGLGPSTLTGVLRSAGALGAVGASSVFQNFFALALQSGLSGGSAVYITAL